MAVPTPFVSIVFTYIRTAHIRIIEINRVLESFCKVYICIG